MTRVIEPAIADLQTEYAGATRGGHLWKSRWTLAVGYMAFAKVAVWCALSGADHARQNWSHDDHRGLIRVVSWSGSAMLLFTFLLLLPELPRTRQLMDDVGSNAGLLRLMAYLLPSALPLSIPVGLALGVAFAVPGRMLSRRLIGAIMLVALAVSIASLGTLSRIIPSTNQAYREAVIGRHIFKGDREMTLVELRRAFNADDQRWARLAQFEFHARLRISAAPITFAVFVLLVATRRRARRIASLGATLVMLFGFYAVMWFGSSLNRDETVSPQLGAWMPQLVLVSSTVLAALVAGCLKAAPTSTQTPA